MKRPSRIVDAHVHLYDAEENHHAFLDRPDPGFEAFVGNYDALPRHYRLTDYLRETQGFNVEGIIWHEFISADPLKEAAWAQRLANAGGMRYALVALVDFLDPALEQKLERYGELPNVTAVREHMVWDDQNPLKRFAKSPDLLKNAEWRKQLGLVKRFGYKCGLEVFGHQLPDLVDVVAKHPDIQFTVAVMGWPLDLGHDGYLRWKKSVAALASCDNVRMSISGLECIFGMKWSMDDATPWVHTAIEAFGPSRCMFGSHMPISLLSRSFLDTYSRYEKLLDGLSEHELDEVFHGVAQRWFNPR